MSEETQIDDGGPAYPNNDAHGCAYPGMTLRQWYAGEALKGLLSNPSIIQPNGLTGWSLTNCTSTYIARFAVSFADETIAAEKEQTNE